MVLKRDKYEVDYVYNLRKDFVDRYLLDNDGKDNEAIRLSYNYLYIKLYNCEYDKKIHQKLKKYL